MQVAEALAMDRSALSRLLRQLTQAHLVEAYPDPSDGRVSIYALTKDARKKMDRALASKGSRFFERLTGWSDAEISRLSELLARLNESGYH